MNPNIATKTMAAAAIAVTSVLGALSPVSAQTDPHAEFPILRSFDANYAVPSPNGDWVLTTHFDDATAALVYTVENLSTGEKRSTSLIEPLGDITRYMVTPNADKAVLTAVAGVHVWSTAAGNVARIANDDLKEGLAISPDGLYVSAITHDGRYVVVSTVTGGLVYTANDYTVFTDDGSVLEFRLDGNILTGKKFAPGSSNYTTYSLDQMCSAQILTCEIDRIQADWGWSPMDEEDERWLYFFLSSWVSSADGSVFFAPQQVTLRSDTTQASNVANATSLDQVVHAWDYTAEDAKVTRLYQAYFGRTPDAEGLRYWIGLHHAGTSLEEIAYWFSQSEEFANQYTGTNNTDYTTRIYGNVLGRIPDQKGFDYWLGLLNDGEIDRSGVVFWVTANDEFIDAYPFLP